MAGSSTGRTNQVNTTEIHQAVNNQDLSKDIKINDIKNIRNHDIVHGNDIGGGHNTFNAVLNTSTGKQIFKLQELLDMSAFNNMSAMQPLNNYSSGGYTTGPVITSSSSTVTSDSHTNTHQSGSHAENNSNDSTTTETTTVTHDKPSETLKKFGGFLKSFLSSDDLQEDYYTTGPVITTHKSDVSVDSHTNVQQSGSRSGSTSKDSSTTTTSVCTPPKYVDYTHMEISSYQLYQLNNYVVPNMLKDPCYPEAQKRAYQQQLVTINQKYGWVSGVY